MRAALAVAILCVGFIGPAAQAEDMDLQRCIWRCLAANGPATNPAYHQCVDRVCVARQHAPAAAPPQTTPWSFINGIMNQSLDVRPGEGPAKLFPDHGDPTVARLAVGFHSFRNRSGGTMIQQNIGLFEHIPEGWRYAGPVTGLFGVDPRDASFAPGRIELTTTVHGLNEPQCCPTQPARWLIDTGSRNAARLR